MADIQRMPSEGGLPIGWTKTDRSVTTDRDSEAWGGLSPLDALMVPRRSSKRLSYTHGNNEALMRKIASVLDMDRMSMTHSMSHTMSKSTSIGPAMRRNISDGSAVIKEVVSDAEEDEPPGAMGPAMSAQRSLQVPIARSAIRRDSQWAFAEKSNTCVIVDWDDTIFPTTWVREDCGMYWRDPLQQQLEAGPRRDLIESLLGKLLRRIEDFFDEATQCTNVFIVTLAKRPWVEMSIRNFMPELATTILNRPEIRIIYAQEYAEGADRQYARSEFMSNEEVKSFWSNVKGAAITQELDEFHRRHNASWKNVISLGDSDFERFGTIAAGAEYMKRELGENGQVLTTGATAEGLTKDGHKVKLRTKTLKMLDEPTVEELTAEITLLHRWLPHMVQRDCGFDIELDNTEDNEHLMAIDKDITGEETELSWKILAGMADNPPDQ